MHLSYAAPLTADAGEMLIAVAPIRASAATRTTENRTMTNPSRVIFDVTGFLEIQAASGAVLYDGQAELLRNLDLSVVSFKPKTGPRPRRLLGQIANSV
jgi:hypothetical protein